MPAPTSLHARQAAYDALMRDLLQRAAARIAAQTHSEAAGNQPAAREGGRDADARSST